MYWLCTKTSGQAKPPQSPDADIQPDPAHWGYQEIELMIRAVCVTVFLQSVVYS